MAIFELQPLRIPAGWYICYNMFSEYDPERDGEDGCLELCEDLLQLEHDKLLIDLGWYPHGDLNGSYKMYMVDKTRERPFEQPLEVFSSKSKEKIIYMLEYWTQSGHYSKYLR